MAQRAIRTTLPDGRTALNNIIDKYTGESIQLVKIDALPGGVSADGIIYFETSTSQFGTEYWVRVEFEHKGTINVMWFGAKGDGVTDDTDAVQQAINSSDAVFIPGGTYMINTAPNSEGGRGLSVKSNNEITLHKNATLKALPQTIGRHYIFDVTGVDSVTIRGGTLDGSRGDHVAPGTEHGMGINIYSSTNITVDSVYIKDCWGDGIYVGGTDIGIASEDEAVPSTGVYIKGCYITNCRRQGISVVCATGVTCENTVIELTNGTMPQALVDIEPNRRASGYPEQDRFGYVRDVLFKGCTFRNGATQGILMVHLDEVSETAIQDITIDGNSFYGNQSTNLVVRRASNVIVINNTFKPSVDQGNGGQVALSGKNVLFSNNIVEKVGDGNYLFRYFKEGWEVDLTVTNNIIRASESATPSLNRVEGEDIQLIFKGNTVVGTWGQIVSMSTGSNLDSAIIDSNNFLGTFTDIFQLAGSSTYANCSVTNNRFGPGLSRCLIRGNNSNFILKGNIFEGNTTRVVDVSDATSGVVDSNQFINTSGTETINIVNTSNLVVQNNFFKDCNNSVAVIYGGTSNSTCKISNNVIVGDNVVGTGVSAVGSDYVIVNNIIEGYSTGLTTASTLSSNTNNTVDGSPMVAGTTRPGFVYRAAAVADGSDIDLLLTALRDAGIIST